MTSLLSTDGLSAFQWTLCAVPIVTTFGRLCIRYRQFRYFQMDDVFNFLALLTLIGLTSVNEFSNRAESVDVDVQLRIQLASNLLYWATLYLVKASFLALIWYIFNVSAGFQKAWWIVVIYTFITWGVIFFTRLWQCGTPLTYDDVQACDYEYLLQQRRTEIIITFALHVSSDLFILALPLIQIRRLSMSISRKVNSIAVFAIIIIDIMAAILKNSVTVFATFESPTDASANISVICEVIEPALAVIVCSLPAYRAVVFKFRSRRGGSQQSPSVALTSRQWWKPRRVLQLPVSIPSPLIDISILQDHSTESRVRRSEETRENDSEDISAKAPVSAHLLVIEAAPKMEH